MPFYQTINESMKKIRLTLNRLIIILIISILTFNVVKAEEEKIEAIIDQIQILNQDLKTLEKAVYKNSDITSSSSSSSNNLNEDVLTKHLLKLNEIEDQFRQLTNRFEEVSFKLDKLSNRVSKVQSDTQLRFSDLESGNNSNLNLDNKAKVQAPLPGTDKVQDFGAAPGENLAATIAHINCAADYGTL